MAVSWARSWSARSTSLASVGASWRCGRNGRASVLRAYVGRLQDQPLPLRLRYAGPVFRNERPQRATYRQFTQVGVELIGGSAPRADAECIALACAGLDAAGVQAYRVRIGHIGLVRGLLRELGLAERTQGLLAWSLERMRQQGIGAVRERLNAAHGELPFDAALLEGLDDAQAEALLLGSLKAIGVNLEFGTRSPEAIVGRLVRKLRREDPQPQIERALALLERLCAIQGPADAALAAAAALLDEFGLPASALDPLRAIINAVAAHRVADAKIVLDFGLGRGLHYYTGAIFEIYDQDDLQLCGGGRYDDLVTALGGRQPVPAVGFAYGLERVVLASKSTTDDGRRTAEVLVVPADDGAYPYALEVAQALRERGYVALWMCAAAASPAICAMAHGAAMARSRLWARPSALEAAVIWRDLANSVREQAGSRRRGEACHAQKSVGPTIVRYNKPACAKGESKLPL